MNKKKIIIVALLFFLLGLKILFDPSPMIIKGLSPIICSEAKYFFETDKPLVALTIDDIPDNNGLFPHTTLGILDVLANYEAKATFFKLLIKQLAFLN